MIPTFPEFKKIDIEDKKDIEKYTHKHKPYSSFNSTNFWAWNTNDDRMISELNGNLVLFFTDYKTSTPFLSFLGNNKPIDTAKKLLDFLETQQGAEPELHFITHETAQKLKYSPFLEVVKDRANSDYIFSTSDLTNLSGPRYKSKRMLVNRFMREYPHAKFELRNFSDPIIQRQIMTIFRTWKNQKQFDQKQLDTEFEQKALKRLMKTSDSHELLLSCVFIEEKMIAFSIEEILPKKCAMAHFVKADIHYKGVFEYINYKIAKCLLSQGVELWNWQQDLELMGLRQLKLSYRPKHFLDKYKITLAKKPSEKAGRKVQILSTRIV